MKHHTIKNYRKISASSGFLIFEALMAMAVLIMIIPAAVSLGLSGGSLQASVENELTSTANATDIITNGVAEQAASSSGRYSHEFGKSTCTVSSAFSPTDFSKIKMYINNPTSESGIDIGLNASATALTARNSFIYETVDSPVQSSPDFFIINAADPAVPQLVSSINTGPGLADIAVAGHYVYVANESSLSQLQVIDIEDRTHPVVSAVLKLPVPQASTTRPHAESLLYDDSRIFLGTVKWSGDEFNIIDVSDPLSPLYLGGFDTDTLVNDVYATSTYAYVADADGDQMRLLDISDPARIALVSGFSPTGSTVLEGKVFGIEGTSTLLYFGRVGGGFNNPLYLKLFVFDLSHDPQVVNPIHEIDVPGGVYGIVVSSGYVFLAVGGNGDAGGGYVEIWKSDLSAMLYSLTLPITPVSLSCDHDRLYVGLAGRQGFAIVTFNE